MANRVHGTTDTSGALSGNASLEKYALIVGEVSAAEEESVTTTPEKIFTIGGVSEAKSKFGSNSVVSEIVATLLRNGCDSIKGIVIDEYGVGKTYTTKSAAITAALEKTYADETIRVILIDSTTSTDVSAVTAHLTTAESYDLFRMFVTAGGNAQSLSDAQTAAKAIDNDRTFYVYPNMVNADGTAVGGVVTAAGVAAVIMTETKDPALPLNGVTIAGFSGVEKVLAPTDKENCHKNCITGLYPANGTAAIYRLVTTSTGQVFKEGTTRMIADTVLETVENRIRGAYKRTKNVARVLDSIKSDVITILQDFEGREIIENFDKSLVSCVKDPTDVYGALVDYTIDVVTPLYTVTITQHLVL